MQDSKARKSQSPNRNPAIATASGGRLGVSATGLGMSAKGLGVLAVVTPFRHEESVFSDNASFTMEAFQSEVGSGAQDLRVSSFAFIVKDSRYQGLSVYPSTHWKIV
jgi:hypothetical protein